MDQVDGKRVAALVGDGFEEAELMEPRRALEEAGAIVTIVGIDEKAQAKIRGKRGLDEGNSVKAEELVADVTADDFDALLIPGGTSPGFLRMNKDVQRFVKEFDTAKKPTFAIGHGMQVLISAQIVRGRTGCKSSSPPKSFAVARSRGLRQLRMTFGTPAVSIAISPS